MIRAYINVTCAVFALAGCNNYQVSINDNVVYEPPKLFADYRIPDSELKECVRSSIEEQGIVQAAELERLICPAGNIARLDGLEVFSNLKILGLAGNQISDITGLARLPKLEKLELKGNDVLKPDGIEQLSELVYLSITESANLGCDSLKAVLSDRVELACEQSEPAT